MSHHFSILTWLGDWISGWRLSMFVGTGVIVAAVCIAQVVKWFNEGV